MRMPENHENMIPAAICTVLEEGVLDFLLKHENRHTLSSDHVSGNFVVHKPAEFKIGRWEVNELILQYMCLVLDITLLHTPVMRFPSCQFFQKESVRPLPRIEARCHLINYLLPLPTCLRW